MKKEDHKSWIHRNDMLLKAISRVLKLLVQKKFERAEEHLVRIEKVYAYRNGSLSIISAEIQLISKYINAIKECNK